MLITMDIEFPKWLYCAYGVLKDWQTFIVGLAALWAALLTVRQIRQQITGDRQRHENAQRSKAWAAKARLPDALSELSGYSEDCMTGLFDSAAYGKVETPVDAISAIKSAIEFVEPDAAKKLYDLVVHYQIHRSRYRSLNSNTPFNLPLIMYSTAHFRALVDELFAFARNEDGQIPVGELAGDQVHSALSLCIDLQVRLANKDMIAEIHELIDQRHPTPRHKQ